MVAQSIEPGVISIWVVIEDGVFVNYAPTYKSLKSALKMSQGTRLVRHYKFPATTENVLGFFKPESGCEFPQTAPVEEFAVLVQGQMIFRSDSE